MLKILCRAQNVVYNVVSISGYELVGQAKNFNEFLSEKNAQNPQNKKKYFRKTYWRSVMAKKLLKDVLSKLGPLPPSMNLSLQKTY